MGVARGAGVAIAFGFNALPDTMVRDNGKLSNATNAKFINEGRENKNRWSVSGRVVMLLDEDCQYDMGKTVIAIMIAWLLEKRILRNGGSQFTGIPVLRSGRQGHSGTYARKRGQARTGVILRLLIPD